MSVKDGAELRGWVDRRRGGRRKMKGQRIWVADSPLVGPVRLPSERIRHILRRRAVFRDGIDMVLKTVSDPDEIWSSDSDPDIRYHVRDLQDPRLPTPTARVVVRVVGDEDAFVATAHPLGLPSARRMRRRGRLLWARPQPST